MSEVVSGVEWSGMSEMTHSLAAAVWLTSSTSARNVFVACLRVRCHVSCHVVRCRCRCRCRCCTTSAKASTSRVRVEHSLCETGSGQCRLPVCGRWFECPWRMSGWHRATMRVFSRMRHSHSGRTGLVHTTRTLCLFSVALFAPSSSAIG